MGWISVIGKKNTTFEEDKVRIKVEGYVYIFQRSVMVFYVTIHILQSAFSI